MRNGILVTVVIIASIAFAFPCAADDLHDLLAEVPFDAKLVIACADAPAFQDQLGEIGAEGMILSLMKEKETDLTDLYLALSGRFLMANGIWGEDFMVIADIEPRGLIARRLAQPRPNMLFGLRMIYVENGIFSLIGDDDEPLAYMAYDGNTARFSNNRDIVSPNPEVPHPKVTDARDFAVLLERFEIDRGLMFFAPGPDYASLFPYQRNHDYIGERMADFLRMGMDFFQALFEIERWGALAARLELDEGPSIEIIRIMRDLPFPPDEGSTLTKPAWAEAPNFSIAGDVDLLKGLMPALRRGFAAADQDILDEFNVELAEVNEELGFDFERDFVGNLAVEWSLSVWDEGGWALRFQLNDPDAFLRQARIMAETGGEPWAPVDDAPDGARVIRTGAYLFPLLLRVEGNAVTMSGAAPIPEPAKAEPVRPVEGETQKILAGCYLFRNRWAEELFEEFEYEGLGEALAAIPLDARLNLSISQGANHHRLTLRTEKLGPENLRVIFGIIFEMME